MGAGFHSTTIEYAIAGAPAVEDLDTIFGTRSRGSFALAGTVGINTFSSQSIFVGINFTPIWLAESYYKDKWLWIANLSLGFQFN